MPFDCNAYGPEVASILGRDGCGERLMPLVHGAPWRPEARLAIEALAKGRVISESALAGLYLYFSFWNEAHEIAQSVSTPEGSYWHAIVHRQEPDAGNSGYWFRQVGVHPIFPLLRDCATAIGVDFGARWNPAAFIDYCEEAQQHPESQNEKRAQEVQRAEWQLLFDYCAASKRIKPENA
jgi:hypothetical protein